MSDPSGKTNIQLVNEKARALYKQEGVPPLLQQLCTIHRITFREFAKIFGISLGHAENIIKHRTFPGLELALAITRYFECTVEELFGWRVDDDGKRRPLLYLDLKTGEVERCGTSDKAIDLARRNLLS